MINKNRSLINFYNESSFIFKRYFPVQKMWNHWYLKLSFYATFDTQPMKADCSAPSMLPQSPPVFAIRAVILLTHTGLVARYPRFIASELAFTITVLQHFHSTPMSCCTTINEGGYYALWGMHIECKNCIPALYGLRSKRADLPWRFDTFIVIFAPGKES